MAACASDSPECPQTITAYCADNGGCPMTWDAAQQPATWGCTAMGGPNVGVTTCGNIHVATRSGIDTGTDFYFDASGQLYGVVAWNANFQSRTCQAGRGPTPACGDNYAQVCPLP